MPQLNASDLLTLRMILREESIPFFEFDEFQFHYDYCNGDLNETIHVCAMIKAEDTTLNISGMKLADESKYFRRLAARYRPNNSGTLA